MGTISLRRVVAEKGQNRMPAGTMIYLHVRFQLVIGSLHLGQEAMEFRQDCMGQNQGQNRMGTISTAWAWA